ncbi:MAG: glycosyltransferase family 4 protein [Planctomycetales bacterium]|nr:glycosyltransferase family 4 protein [Planctomycetales bacterium]
MLNYEFPPIGGGAGHAHRCLLDEYSRRADMQVDVLTSHPGTGLVIEAFAPNIRIFKVGIRKKNMHYWTRPEIVEWLWKARRLHVKLLSENAYHLCHAFFAFPTGWLCWRTAGQLPYILSLRGSDVPGYNVRLGLDYALLAGLFRRIWSGASLIAANSRGLCQLAKRFMPNLDIAVIPNGVDTRCYHPAPQRKTGGPINLLSVGRLIARKRIDWLIDAVGVAVQKGLDVRLTIVGEGNLLAELRKKAVDLNLSDRVVLMGLVGRQQMPEVYRANDIFVMASQHEGMSNAMLEAIASGLPVVTTPCEGAEELIGDNGILVAYPDAQEFAAAVSAIMTDPNKYDAMSKAGRAIAETFSWSAVARQYIDHYEHLMR